MDRSFTVIPLPLGTITCGNQRDNRPALHLGEFDTIGMVWQSDGNGSLYVRGDFGAAKPVDFMSVIWANAQPETTIRLRLGANQAAVDGGAAPYDSGVLPFIDPAIARDDGLYSSHLELPGIETRRWWRVDIGGHAGDFEAAMLVLGTRVQAATFYSPGWTFGVEDLGDISPGRWGVADETPGLIFRNLSFKLGWLSEQDYETKFRPLAEKLGKRRVAFWCFDPAPGPYRQARSYMGWIQKPSAATGGTVVGKYEQEFEILSMI